MRPPPGVNSYYHQPMPPLPPRPMSLLYLPTRRHDREQRRRAHCRSARDLTPRARAERCTERACGAGGAKSTTSTTHAPTRLARM
eukprot:225680-Rhodomonas_salina.2